MHKNKLILTKHVFYEFINFCKRQQKITKCIRLEKLSKRAMLKAKNRLFQDSKFLDIQKLLRNRQKTDGSLYYKDFNFYKLSINI